jgi:hypothetical protein
MAEPYTRGGQQQRMIKYDQQDDQSSFRWLRDGVRGCPSDRSSSVNSAGQEHAWLLNTNRLSTGDDRYHYRVVLVVTMNQYYMVTSIIPLKRWLLLGE